jgi:ParB-like nuclease domain
MEIDSSIDYGSFKLLKANRDVDEGHLNTLRKSFEENGNLTKIDPVLVNEKKEVIDGQHRVILCEELGLPVYYMVVPGLTVADARSMNVAQKTWNARDYAKSYAESGMKAYQVYLELQGDYNLAHDTMLTAIYGNQRKGAGRAFRHGELEIADLAKTKATLDVIASVRELTHITSSDFYRALVNVSKAKGYEHKHMMEKLAMFAEGLYHPMRGVPENARLLEDIYNYHSKEANRLRLY